MDADFSSSRLSLLDRGFVYAIAHVRGGGELGQQWYEDGKFLLKKNTFNDYLDVCDALLKMGYGAPSLCYGMGGSAGGMLMGVAINERPELFHGVIAQVPFVDVVTTMLDESIPLTTGEFEEWGGLAPIFPYTFYHLTHYWFAAADIPVANDTPVHYADAIRCNVRRPPRGSLPLLTRRVSA
ncbi:protease 2 [Citrobacter freundii]|nr:protease 2 [Citrobacter freundii]